MWEADCGCLPVVDDRNRVSGIITDRDVCMAAYLQGQRLEDIRVQSVMSREVVCCRPNDDLATAEELMQTRQVRRLPVVDQEERLVGLLALNDLARAATNGGARKISGLAAGDLARTLGAICAPRTRVAVAG